jgi:ketosteroid isomerase-like protein
MQSRNLGITEQPLKVQAETGGMTDEAEIRGLIDDWVKAVRAKDISRIMPHYAPDVLSFDLAPPLEYEGREARQQGVREIALHVRTKLVRPCRLSDNDKSPIAYILAGSRLQRVSFRVTIVRLVPSADLPKV